MLTDSKACPSGGACTGSNSKRCPAKWTSVLLSVRARFRTPLVSGPAGGFNKAKVDHGGPPVGNRYLIVRFENEAAYDKFYSGGKEWIDKHAPEAREIKVEGVEPK